MTLERKLVKRSRQDIVNVAGKHYLTLRLANAKQIDHYVRTMLGQTDVIFAVYPDQRSPGGGGLYMVKGAEKIDAMAKTISRADRFTLDAVPCDTREQAVKLGLGIVDITLDHLSTLFKDAPPSGRTNYHFSPGLRLDFVDVDNDDKSYGELPAFMEWLRSGSEFDKTWLKICQTGKLTGKQCREFWRWMGREDKAPKGLTIYLPDWKREGE